MAMLAEPRKRKQYNLVPRGKALYEDDSRFGTKMLEKMGWSKGKGLGANEDGIKDFVRVRCRNRAEGLGFEDRDDQWTQHEESFTGLLDTLNGGSNAKDEAKEDVSGDERPATGFGFPADRKKKKEKLTEKISGESLEEKSKQSKARVHYKKFTRGKDLSRYSEKDLLNIFGKKADDEKDQNAIYQQFASIVVEPQDNEKESTFGVHTGLSVSDYFKQKMDAMKNRMKNGFKPEKEEKESLVEREEESDKQNEEIVEEEEPKKKKKKRNKDNIEDEGVELIAEATEESVEEEVIKKKKKKSKNKENDKANVEAEEVVEIEIKKSKKIKNEESSNDTVCLVVESNEATSKKSKKRKHKEVAIETETIADETTELSAKKSKKKKSLESQVNTLSLPTEKAAIANSKKSKKDVSPPEIPNIDSNAGGSELLSLDDLIVKRNSYNVYTISSFCAEKFRNVDLERFAGSSMPSIMGYSLNDDLELNIKTIPGDEHRITQLWNCTLNKYKDAAPKRNTYHYYQKQVRTARRTKQKKIPHFHVKTWKRKQVFQGI